MGNKSLELRRYASRVHRMSPDELFDECLRLHELVSPSGNDTHLKFEYEFGNRHVGSIQIEATADADGKLHSPLKPVDIASKINVEALNVVTLNVVTVLLEPSTSVEYLGMYQVNLIVQDIPSEIRSVSASLWVVPTLTLGHGVEAGNDNMGVLDADKHMNY